MVCLLRCTMCAWEFVRFLCTIRLACARRGLKWFPFVAVFFLIHTVELCHNCLEWGGGVFTYSKRTIYRANLSFFVPCNCFEGSRFHVHQENALMDEQSDIRIWVKLAFLSCGPHPVTFSFIVPPERLPTLCSFYCICVFYTRDVLSLHPKGGVYQQQPKEINSC